MACSKSYLVVYQGYSRIIYNLDISFDSIGSFEIGYNIYGLFSVIFPNKGFLYEAKANGYISVPCKIFYNIKNIIQKESIVI